MHVGRLKPFSNTNVSSSISGLSRRHRDNLIERKDAKKCVRRNKREFLPFENQVRSELTCIHPSPY